MEISTKARAIIRRRIHLRLTELGWSCGDLAHAIGCSRGHTYNIIESFRTGKRCRAKIQNALGIPIWNDLSAPDLKFSHSPQPEGLSLASGEQTPTEKAPR